MDKIDTYFKNVVPAWRSAWQQKAFRNKLIAGIFLIVVILIGSSYFFQYIEKRQGFLFNDPILKLLPAYNVYLIVFILVWTNAFLMLLTSIKRPSIFLTFLIAYILLFIARGFSIFLLPLETPPGIINLTDPLSNYFYGVDFITKDLFFSGHTATLFLIYLCQDGKLKKYYAFIACLGVGILVLIQHIHYSIDVIFAFPFTYLCYRSAKYLNTSSV